MIRSQVLMGSAKNLGAVGSGGVFNGFVDADFAAFEPKKWSSNVYTLERRKTKDKLLALAKQLEERLKEEINDLEMGATDEAPTISNGRKVQFQRVFLTRGASDRTSLKKLLNKTDLHNGAGLFDISIDHQHGCLVVCVEQSGLWTGIELAGKAKVDRDNLAEKLKQSWAVDKFLGLIHQCPQGSQIGFVGQDLQITESVTAEMLPMWIEALKTNDQPFTVRCTITKEAPEIKTTDIIEKVSADLKAFLALFRFVMWTRDNDQVQVKEAVTKQAEDRQKKVTAAFSPGDRVTILSGLFAGRSGYLAEIDTKGKAKVMVGPVSVGVEVKDLKGQA